LPASLTRSAFAAAILAVSVMIHVGLLGVIVFAERRVLTPVENELIEVELMKPQELPKQEVPKQELPKQEAAKPEQPQAPKPPEQKKPDKPDLSQSQAPQPKSAPKSAQKNASVSPPDQPENPEPPAEEKQDKPDIPSGGAPSESKAKLTAEEIAAFRAQVQKCWQLPVGMPDAMKLEVVLRVGLSRAGTLVAAPELLKAPASANGPMLVGIAMKAMTQCGPYKTLPVAKYKEWRVLDLRFLATGMTGLDNSKIPRG
jgi:outer membrane biosynthesis protein TonB